MVSAYAIKKIAERPEKKVEIMKLAEAGKS